jgi:enoyl-CoA hydratase/3-hydroxyacyl-CoA dehydrogenase
MMREFPRKAQDENALMASDWSFASIAVEGRSGVLRMHRGELNALNEAMVVELSGALEQFSSDPRIDSIVITGTAQVFMAGADLPFFARCLLRGEIDRILTFTRACHELLSRIERSSKPVIAWVRGPALGAGLELALACHQIVAGDAAKFAFPETGLGIYPGMGGTQRTPRRIGRSLAKWLIGTGSPLPAAAALELGLVDRLAPDADCALEAWAVPEQPIVRRALSPRYQALAALFGEHSLVALSDERFAAPAEPQCVRALVQLRGKAPLALAAVDRLIEQGMQLPLTQGIEEEFKGLEAIFRSDDARTGILTFGKQTPQFAGR